MTGGGRRPEDAHDGVPTPMTVTRPEDLAELRRNAQILADVGCLDSTRAANLTVAVTEIASNALLHGGGSAVVRFHVSATAVTIDIVDHGPGLAAHDLGRRPEPGALGGRGLWLARELCDDIGIDAAPEGTSVHLSMHRP
jgi:anti-sigma regulatory factor (Ser/Thr protein kinase)